METEPTGATHFVKTCGHRFNLTATCETCRRYVNWKRKGRNG